MFSYHCQFCQQRLLAAPERAGQKTICPKCLRPVTIPDPEGEPMGGPAVNFNDKVEGFNIDQQPSMSTGMDGLDDWTSEPIAVEPDATVTPPPVRRVQPQPPQQPRPAAQPAAPRPEPKAQPKTETPPPARPRPQSQPAIQQPQPVAQQPHDATPLPVAQLPARKPPAATPSRPAPLVTRKLEASGGTGGLVVLNPTGMASVDLAAELTATLTMRMKPPQEPPSDLRLSTAVAIVVTMVGFCLWVAGIVMEPDPLPFVALLGVLILCVGWIWAIHLASLHGWMNAIFALFPPITLWYLVRPSSDNGARPLLYVICGAMLLGLFVIAQPIRWRFHQLMTNLDPVKSVTPAKPPTPSEKIRSLLERRNNPVLQDYLDGLANQDSRPQGQDVLEEEDRLQLAETLRGLLKPGPTTIDSGIRASALTVYAHFCTSEARSEVLKALTATERPVRRAALAASSRWPDLEMANAVAARLSDNGDSDLAQVALKVMGGPAETALVALLKSKDPFFQMLVIGMLEQNKNFTVLSIDSLDKLSKEDPTSNIRQEAARVAEVLRKAKKDK